MATYAIGDIQGCYQSLQKLLNKIEFCPNSDRLWLVGDLINRGPQSLETLEFLYSIKDSLSIVLGNHDLHFLAVAEAQLKVKKSDTFNAILQSANRQQLTDWLLQQPLFHYDKSLNFAMAHAGIAPQWSVQEALVFANQVSQFIQSDQRQLFFSQMYGNEPCQWYPQLSGIERLRFITNVFTRMRYCRADLSLEFSYKSKPGTQPDTLFPWFDIPREPLGCRFVFGHWASLKGECRRPNMYAIDTGCVWGKKLTALRLEDQVKISVKAQETQS
ncbi:symmetrical bis(5'-nucleosyl)-tetraphosphatase [Aliikangiella sp. IMCC44653]